MRRVLLGVMVLGLAGCGLSAAQQKMIDERSYVIGQERYIKCNIPVGKTSTHPELHGEDVKFGEKIKVNTIIWGPDELLYYGGVVNSARQVYIWMNSYNTCTSEDDPRIEADKRERAIKDRQPVKIGMMRSEVEATGWHGTLLRRYVSEKGRREIWMFADNGYFLGYLTFMNDKLVLVEQKY